MATNPSTFLIKTVRGVRRYVVYYDPDVFHDKILLSASLLLGSNYPEGTPDVPLDAVDYEIESNGGISHYNTIHDEDKGLSGTDFKLLDEIAIAIYPKPKSTKIVGAKKVEKNSSFNYHIDPHYDENNLFSYEWEIDGDASFDGSNTNTKSVKLIFGSTDGKVVLKCKISNISGCFRYIIKTIYIGIITKEMLVVRNIYF